MANSNWSGKLSLASKRERAEGNEYYNIATKRDGIAPVLKRSKLQEAIKCYQKALNSAGSDLDAASSAAKNYAKTSYELLRMCSSEDGEMKNYFYRECLEHYSKALEYGEECKSPEWLQQIEILYRELFDEVLDACYELVPTTQQRIAWLESFCCVIRRGDKLYVNFSSEIAKFWLTEACVALNEKDYKASLNALKEIYRPIEEVKRFARCQ